jgi:hypothetical protein
LRFDLTLTEFGDLLAVSAAHRRSEGTTAVTQG